ncbi:MAG: tRNA (adenosine(37)-N6)-threonylcarbamoyltransferase complex ATPase subunit type 1 TsaE [Deltaproteobacteria bacterium]
METKKSLFNSCSPEDTEGLGERFSKTLSPGSRVGLVGELGAGKTSFVRGIARGLGAEGAVKSPSYAILNIYEGGRLPLYHIDLYRLNTVAEFHDAGLGEYFFGIGVCVVEWADSVPQVLGECDAVVRFSWRSETLREIAINEGFNKEAG